MRTTHSALPVVPLYRVVPMSTAQWPFYTACGSLIQGDPLYTACGSLIQDDPLYTACGSLIQGGTPFTLPVVPLYRVTHFTLPVVPLYRVVPTLTTWWTRLCPSSWRQRRRRTREGWTSGRCTSRVIFGCL